MLKIHARLLIITVVVSMLLSGSNCSSPVAGVETGNPKMIVCSRIAFALFDSTSAWSPTVYLTGGASQLNPNVLNNKPILTKKLLKTSTDTDTQQIGNTTNLSIVKRIDTIINTSTILIKDTLVNTSIKIDTVSKTTWTTDDTDTIFIFNKSLVTDSVFIVDTIFLYDTTKVVSYDTLNEYPGKVTTDQAVRGNIVQTITTPVNLKAYYTALDVHYDSISRLSIPNQESSKYASQSSSDLMQISRLAKTSNNYIFEEYSDADGDGILNITDGNQNSILNLNAQYFSAADSIQLNVLFDPGIDISYADVDDNRIHTLRRVTTKSAMIREEIDYRKFPTFLLADSTILSINRIYNSDSISHSTTRYACLHGDDSLDYRQNRLAQLSHTRVFRSGKISRIQVILTPHEPLAISTEPSTADFEAFIDYGKGLAGVFKGVLDFGSKYVSGTYAENGIEYDYKYNFSLNESEIFNRL